jgi:cag pathogenicity island protein 24
MQYKRLTTEELTALEKEFIQFLSANTVTKLDWEKLINDNSEKVEELIELFSDIVWDKSIENIKYLEFCGEKNLKTFYCGQDNIVLRGLTIQSEQGSFITQTLAELLDLNSKNQIELGFISSEKDYQPNRNQEIFYMIKNGCTISTPELFESLKVS